VIRSKRRRLWIGLAATVSVAAVVWLMLWSPLLSVREVKVAGAVHTPESAVLEAAALEGTGQNLLRLSTGEVAARIAVLPWVASVDVDRMLPGTVKVRIVERTPAMVLSLGAARWTIDAEGHVLEPGAVEKGLPALAGVEVGRVAAGMRLQTEESLAALEVFRSLAPALRTKVAAIFAPTIERITFSLADGTVVRFGAAEDIQAKNRVLKALLERLKREGRKVAYVDVRVPTSPAISEATPAPPGATPIAAPSPTTSP